MDPWIVPPPLPPVSIEIGAQPAQPPAQAGPTTGSFVYAVAVGALPPILAGLVVWWVTRKREDNKQEA